MINLTQHPASQEQLKAGVVDLPPEQRTKLQQLLTFDFEPYRLATIASVEARCGNPAIGDDVWYAASKIVEMAVESGHKSAMIGGALFSIGPLTKLLYDANIVPAFAYSRRESVEEKMPDGSTKKTAIFKHVGFVQAHIETIVQRW